MSRDTFDERTHELLLEILGELRHRLPPSGGDAGPAAASHGQGRHGLADGLVARARDCYRAAMEDCQIPAGPLSYLTPIEYYAWTLEVENARHRGELF